MWDVRLLFVGVVRVTFVLLGDAFLAGKARESSFKGFLNKLFVVGSAWLGGLIGFYS